MILLRKKLFTQNTFLLLYSKGVASTLSDNVRYGVFPVAYSPAFTLRLHLLLVLWVDLIDLVSAAHL